MVNEYGNKLTAGVASLVLVFFPLCSRPLLPIIGTLLKEPVAQPRLLGETSGYECAPESSVSGVWSCRSLSLSPLVLAVKFCKSRVKPEKDKESLKLQYYHQNAVTVTHKKIIKNGQ